MSRIARVALVFCLALGWELHPATTPEVAAAICDETFCGTIEIVFSPGSGVGRVTSDPSGLDCTWTGSARTGTCVYTYHWPYFIGGTNAIDLYLDPNVGSYACYSLVCGNHDQTLVRTIQLNAGDDRDLFPGFDLAPHLRLTIKTGGNHNGRVTTSKGGIDCVGTAGAESGTCVGDLYWNVGENPRFFLTADPADGAFACMYESCHVPNENRVSDVGAGLGTNTLDVDFWEARPITVTITGKGSVVSKPAGISCPPTCSKWFPVDNAPDDWTEFHATPAAGWFIKSWSGCSNIGDFGTVEDNVCPYYNYKFGGSIGIVFATNATQPPATPAPTPRATTSPGQTPRPTPTGALVAEPTATPPPLPTPAPGTTAVPGTSAVPIDDPSAAPEASGAGPLASASTEPGAVGSGQPAGSAPVTAGGGPGASAADPGPIAGGAAPSGGIDSFVLVLFAVLLVLLLGLGFALGRRRSGPAPGSPTNAGGS